MVTLPLAFGLMLSTRVAIFPARNGHTPGGIGKEDRADLHGWNAPLYRARTVTAATGADEPILPREPLPPYHAMRT